MNVNLLTVSLRRVFLLAIFTLLINIFFVSQAAATPNFVSKIPEGNAQDCSFCHTQFPKLNETGQAFKNNGFEFPATAASVETKQPAETKEETQEAVQKAEEAETVGAEEETAEVEETAVSEEPEVASVTPEILLTLPDGISRGEKTELMAKVTTDGAPAECLEVKFFEKANFFIEGAKKLGAAVTDANGLAAVKYWPQATEEKVEIIAQVAGNDKISAAETTGTFELVVEGPLVKEAEGLHIPFLGFWLVAALVLAVWGIYGYVVVGMLRFSKLGEVAETTESVRVEEKQHA